METHMSDALRPISFDAYVGQPRLIERLRILVAAARSRGEPLGHVLLHGPPGLGKTTLANIIAREMDLPIKLAMGPGIDDPQDLYGMLGRLGTGILFIDEIHRIPAAVGECLYEAMEDQRLTIMAERKEGSEPVTLELPPFTLIGATTQPGLLEAPLRERFPQHLPLDFYSPADLSTILMANAHKLGMICDAEALLLVASRSRGTPRIANHHLKFCRAYVDARGDGRLTLGMAEAALKMQEIDNLGLTAQDRNYLRVLRDTYDGGPAGAQALAATMGLTVDSLASVIEPYALQTGLIARTQRGRCLTDKGLAHIQNLATA